MTDQPQPLDLADVRARFEASTSPAWRDTSDTGRLFAELDRTRAWLETARAAARAQDAEVRRLTAELQQTQQRNAAVLALLPADPAEDINAPFIPLRRIRAAATGQPDPAAPFGA